MILAALSAMAVIAAVFAVGFVGAILHELTHYATARLLGLRATIDWLAMDCFTETTTDRWRVRVVALAPVLVGVPVAAWWLSVGAPALYPGVIFFGLYIGFSVPDFKAAWNPPRANPA